MKDVKLSPEEIETILWYIKPRIKSAAGVMTEDYARQFFADKTPEYIAEVHKERREEIQMLEALVSKLEA